jgi:hypothetical protein
MKKTGNLFEVARQNLEKKKRPFTPMNVIEEAIRLRKVLDDKEDERRRKINRKYYLKRRKK